MLSTTPLPVPLLLVSPSALLRRLLPFDFLLPSSSLASSPRVGLLEMPVPLALFGFESFVASLDGAAPSFVAASSSSLPLFRSRASVATSLVAPLRRVNGKRFRAPAPSTGLAEDDAPALALCLADRCTRNPNTLGTYADADGRRSGTRLEKVIKNK